MVLESSRIFCLYHGSVAISMKVSLIAGLFAGFCLAQTQPTTHITAYGNSSTCTGQTAGDEAAFNAWQSAAYSWQTSSGPGLVTLILDQNGTTNAVSNVSFGTGATATTTQSGGVIQTPTVTAAGTGYVQGATFANVTGSGGGSGAVLAVTVTSGGVASISVTDGGTGYSGTITITIQGAYITTSAAHGWSTGQWVMFHGGEGAFFSTAISGGGVSSVTQQQGGYFYSSGNITATFEGGLGPEGVAATVTGITLGGTNGQQITGITYTPGSGYIAAPQLLITNNGIGGILNLDVGGALNIASGQKALQITVIDTTHFAVNVLVSGTYGSGGEVDSNICMFPGGDAGNYQPFTSGGYAGGAGLNNVKVTTTDGTQVTSVGISDVGGAGGLEMAGRGPIGTGPAGAHTARTASVGSGATSVTLIPTAAVTTTACASSPCNTTTITVASSNIGIVAGQTVNCVTTGCGLQSGTTVVSGGGGSTTVVLSLAPSGLSNASIYFSYTVASECALFPSGVYAMEAAIDLQGSGFPQNPAFLDFVNVSGCNTSTGVTTLQSTSTCSGCGSLSNAYSSSYPLFNAGDLFHSDQGGPATLFQLDPSWNVKIEFDGETIDQTGQSYCVALSCTYNNMVAPGGNCPIPTQDYLYTINYGTMSGCDIEIDKMIGTFTCNYCIVRHFISASASFNLTFENSIALESSGTGRNTTCTNSSFLQQLAIGVPSYGIGNSFAGNNCNLAGIVVSSQSYQTATSGVWTSISNGQVLTTNASGPPLICVPGFNLYWNGGTSSGVAGYPFTVTNMTQDSTYTYCSESLGGGIPPIPNYKTMLSFPVKTSTCVNCSGNIAAYDFNNTLQQNLPIFTYSQRILNPVTSQANLYNGTAVSGAIQSIAFNVIEPYTGSDHATLSFHLSEFDNWSNLDVATNTQTNYGPVINLKTAGVRTVTPTGVTGTQTGDSGLTLPGVPYYVSEFNSPWLSASITGSPDNCPASAPTSTSSLTIGTGSQTITTQSGLSYSSGQAIAVVDGMNGSIYETGTVTSYSGTSLVVNITSTVGSGTYNNWVLSIVPCPMITLTIQTSQAPTLVGSTTFGSGIAGGGGVTKNLENRLR
jgi:hypothetical protein